MEKKMMSSLHRITIVLVLLLVVVAVFVFKGKKEFDIVHGTRDTIGVVAESLEHSIYEHTDSTIVTSVPRDTLGGDKEPISKTTAPIDLDILAVVNGEEITQAQFDSTFNMLPSQMKDYFKDDKGAFLEELILKQLLLQEANRKKVQEQPEDKTTANQNPGQEAQVMINLLLRELVADVSISEQELRDFFNQYKDQLPNKDYESVKEQLRPMAQEEKERQVIETHINNLKSHAEITRNERWIKEQEMLAADNPLTRALQREQPVVADFGRGTCIPCKMMQPILEKLEKEYEDKASILILDVGEYASLARKYQIMMIPTQIFFDSAGKEVYRHQGFMPEEDIVAQLKKLGVE